MHEQQAERHRRQKVNEQRAAFEAGKQGDCLTQCASYFSPGS
jgi:hypothetical protein